MDISRSLSQSLTTDRLHADLGGAADQQTNNKYAGDLLCSLRGSHSYTLYEWLQLELGSAAGFFLVAPVRVHCEGQLPLHAGRQSSTYDGLGSISPL